MLGNRLGMPIFYHDGLCLRRSVRQHTERAVKAMLRYRWQDATKELNEAVSLTVADNLAMVSILSLLAVCHETTGRIAEASRVLAEALFYAQAENCPQAISTIANSIGYLCQTTGRFDLARAHHQEALRAAEAAGSEQLCAWSHHYMGNVFRHNGNLLVAEQEHGKALTISKTYGYWLTEAWAYGGLGLVHRRRGQSQMALDNLTNAYRMFVRLENLRGQAWALLNIAEVFVKQGQWSLAVEHIDQSLDRNRLVGRIEGSAMRRKALVLVQKGTTRNLDEALACLRSALETDRKTGDKLGEGRSLADLGYTYYQKRDLVNARKYCEKGLTIQNAVGTLADRSWTQWLLAIICYAEGKVGDARVYLDEALAAARRADDQKAVGRLLGSLGEAERLDGKLDRALSLFQQALAACEQSDYRTRLPWTLRKTAQTLVQMGRIKEAAQYAERAFRAAQDAGLDEQLWKALELRARLYILSCDYEKARELLEQAMQIAFNVGRPEDLADLRQLLAEVNRPSHLLQKGEKPEGK